MTIEHARTGSAHALSTLLARREPGRPLEAPFYTDPAVFEADVAGVWARTWILVAVEAEVAEPGDFVTVEVGSWSVIVVRDDDEEVRGLHNVCRHRGARVLTERAGSVGNIVCGYHQWTYADRRLPDARRGAAPHLRQELLRAQAGARARRRRAGVRLPAEDAPEDFDEVAGRLAPYLAPHELHRTKVAAQLDLVEEATGSWSWRTTASATTARAGTPS